MADASAIDGMGDELDAPIVGSGNDGNDARTWWKICDERLRVSLYPRNFGRVLIVEDEEHDGANGKAGDLPFVEWDEAKHAEAEDGCYGCEPGNEQANPAREQITVDIFRDKRGGGKCHQVKLNRQTERLRFRFRFGDEAGKVWEETENNPKEHNPGENQVTLAVEHELVGTIHPVKRARPPVGHKPRALDEVCAQENITYEDENRQQPFEITRKNPVKRNITDRAAKPEKADGMREVDEWAKK